MNQIEFIYEGRTIIIERDLEDKMKDLFNKFANKAKLDLNDINFLYNGDILNDESKYNEINKGNNKITILVNDKRQKLFLEFKLNDYNIFMNFGKKLNIKLEHGESLNKKRYNGSFSLDDLKKKSKLFKMYDCIQDTYKDIKKLLEKNLFYIKANEKTITLCINETVGIDYDIVFPLEEASLDIKEIVDELCEKNINLEKKVDILTEKNTNLENIIKEMDLKFENQINEINLKFEKKIYDLESQIKILISNNNDGLTNDERNKIKSFFSEKIPKQLNLLYSGFDREEFFEKCNGKDNLLFLIHDERGKKYGGYMSSKLIKNEKEDEKGVIIRDEKSFLFNLDLSKKFTVIKPEQAIIVRDDYLICFGGNFSGSDFFIFDNKAKKFYGEKEKAGSYNTDSYGDYNYETTGGKGRCKMNELKIYQLLF